MFVASYQIGNPHKNALKKVIWKQVFTKQMILPKSVLKFFDMDVSEKNGTPKSSILIGFSIINHPFWGIPIVGNIHMLNEEKYFEIIFFMFPDGKASLLAGSGSRSVIGSQHAKEHLEKCSSS